MTGSAPLLSTAAAPVPAGGVAEWVSGAGGARLRAALFPAAEPHGSVLLSPGRTEPIEKYYEVVDELRGRGLSVLVHDWRGQGLSSRLAQDPLKGHGGPCAAYLEDLARVFATFEARLPRPLIGLGHSMGGGLTAVAAIGAAVRFDAVVLSSPMLGLNLGARPPALVGALAWMQSRLGRAQGYVSGPGDPLGGDFEANVLTHDRVRWARTRGLLEAHPELQLGNVTWGWLDLAFQIAGRAARWPGPLGRPLAVVTAGEERLVDNTAARAFAAKSPGADYLEIADAYHELLMETDGRRAMFWGAFDRVVAKL